MIRILIADDHTLFREGVRLLLEREGFCVVGEAADGEEAVRLAQQLEVDVHVLDFGMPVLNGIDAAREIRRKDPEAKMVLLTMYQDETYVLEALRAGFAGYVFKAQTDSDLVHTLREVAQGALYLGPNIPQSVIEVLTSNTQSAESLTERERQVVDLIADGKTSKQIAQVLGLSPKTIESHRSRIMQKLNFEQSTQLVCYAVRTQLSKPVMRR
ncbi:MAG: response regulator transcription factor [Pseudohongiellaceae bacterium]